MKDRNEVLLGGTIVSIQTSASRVTIRIATDATGTTNYPAVLFYQPKIVQDFKVRDRVIIKAHIQERRTRDEKGNTKAYYQDCVGDEIMPMKRLLADYVDERMLPDDKGGFGGDKNDAFFCGTVSHIYSPKEGIVILSVRIDAREVIDYVEVTCFRRQASTAILLSEGDYVAAACTIHTQTSKKDERITNQNAVCKDIAKID